MSTGHAVPRPIAAVAFSSGYALGRGIGLAMNLAEHAARSIERGAQPPAAIRARASAAAGRSIAA